MWEAGELKDDDRSQPSCPGGVPYLLVQGMTKVGRPDRADRRAPRPVNETPTGP